MATTEDILRTLSAELPEELLRELFPSLQPATVRTRLKALAEKIGPGPRKPETTPKKEGARKRLTLFSDGASRGNPGEAGAGIALYTEQGEEIAAQGVYLGQCTNNMAEYQALLLGLGEALRQGARDIAVFLDSELIVRQLKGQYRVKNEKLKPLFSRARELLARFRTFEVSHVPRRENQRADQLANQAIDEKHG